MWVFESLGPSVILRWAVLQRCYSVLKRSDPKLTKHSTTSRTVPAPQSCAHVFSGPHQYEHTWNVATENVTICELLWIIWEQLPTILVTYRELFMPHKKHTSGKTVSPLIRNLTLSLHIRNNLIKSLIINMKKGSSHWENKCMFGYQ